MLTGQRRNDWAHAKRREIDLGKDWLEIAKARYKSRREHIVPLCPQALEILSNTPSCSSPDSFIFSSREGRVPVSGFSRAKAIMDAQACALMNVEDPTRSFQNYRLHDFRVTCETRLATLGFNQDIRDAVLGHAKQGLQRTYNKYDYHEEKKAALETYAAHLVRIVE